MKDYVQGCQIDRGLFFKLYQAWCKSQGITHPKNQRQLIRYLKENIRMWSNDVEGQLKMSPMIEKQTPKVVTCGDGSSCRNKVDDFCPRSGVGTEHDENTPF
jgi:hypothetical protein